MGRIEKIKRELIEEANKRILGENVKLEPIKQKMSKPLKYTFIFNEGDGDEPMGSINSFYSEWESPVNEKSAIYTIGRWLRDSLPTIFKFVDTEFEDQLEGIIKLSSQTSSSGSDRSNANVGEERLEYVKGLAFKALDQIGVKDTSIKKLLTSYTESDYDTTKLPSYMDKDKVDPVMVEQQATIEITPVYTEGLETDGITDIEHDIEAASGFWTGTEEDDIVSAIEGLQNYSDIEDLNKRFGGNLEGRINGQITDGVTQYGSDTEERKDIRDHLNKIAHRSGKTDIAKIVGDKLVIILDQ
jgi:hypothetical protein